MTYIKFSRPRDKFVKSEVKFFRSSITFYQEQVGGNFRFDLTMYFEELRKVIFHRLIIDQRIKNFILRSR